MSIKKKRSPNSYRNLNFNQFGKKIQYNVPNHSNNQMELSCPVLDSMTPLISLPEFVETPSALKSDSIVFDPESRNIYVFGGSMQRGNATNELWKFHVDNRTWEQIIPVGDLAPPECMSSGIVLHQGHIFISGGYHNLNGSSKQKSSKKIRASNHSSNQKTPSISAPNSSGQNSSGGLFSFFSGSSSMNSTRS